MQKRAKIALTMKKEQKINEGLNAGPLHFMLNGMRDSLPIVMGYVPVAVAFAVLALQTGFTPLQTICLSLTSYSGSGQFLGVAMAGAGAGLITVAIGGFLISFRYFVMSTCVFARFKTLSTVKRLFLSHFVTDETFALFTTNDEKYVNVPYFLGLFLSSYLSWNFGTALGLFVSEFLPETVTLGLGIALYALFIAIILPGCRADVKVLYLVLCVAVSDSVLYLLFEKWFGGSATSWAIVITMVAGALIGALFIKTPEEKAEDLRS